ncbi:DEAD/DEAH box helicase [Paenibacillus gorillae]|uniref:DEAD/DEAH box helicase n=1 Tax=Paenibacillus gorillae TaxID=1243662 RepID=UPI0004B26B88|nr:DEAD/DEAH box helicase [Paenibacillus gorillae]
MSTEFTTMGIIPELTDKLHHEGITTPTPVQQKAIPVLLAGQDVIAQAQTGTGKTIAFALPILQRIDVTKEQVQALILTPTRELAIQITSELTKLAPVVGAKVLAAYGGQDVVAQIRKLNNAPHIVVATPGRLIDHMKRETINLGKLRMLVLDEADQMLHMGFLSEVEGIINQTPRARQTMLFSATMPDAIKRLAENYMKTPVDIRIKSANVTLDSIKQLVIETSDRGRQDALIHLIEQHRPYLAVVFCRTKVRAKKLNEALQDHGFASDELHGDLTQAKREQVMKRFRDAKLQILVATDVAARGLDVEGVTHVFNYDVPQDSEIYIHRIGRTGRAGQRGVAVTLVSQYDRGAIQHIERNINAVLERRAIDSEGNIIASSTPRAEAKASAKGGKGAERGGRRGGGERNANNDRGRGRSSAGRSGGRTVRDNRTGTGSSRSKRGDAEVAGVSENPWQQDRETARGSRSAGNAGRGGRNAAPAREGRGSRGESGAPARERGVSRGEAPAREGRGARNTGGAPARDGRGARSAGSPEGPASWGAARSTSKERGERPSGGSRSGGKSGGPRSSSRGTRPSGPSGNRRGRS